MGLSNWMSCLGKETWGKGSGRKPPVGLNMKVHVFKFKAEGIPNLRLVKEIFNDSFVNR